MYHHIQLPLGIPMLLVIGLIICTASFDTQTEAGSSLFSLAEIPELISPVNGTVLLQCDVQYWYDNLVHILEWFKDTERYLVFQQNNGYVPYVDKNYTGRVTVANLTDLILSQVQVADSGIYFCKVNFLDGADIVHIQATNLRILAPPSLTYTPLSYVTGREGTVVTLRCEATGTPTPTLTWYKDGVQLAESQRLILQGSALQISNLIASDVGKYRCTHTNTHGHASYTTTLVLEGGAIITQPPRNTTVIVSSQAHFSCGATGSPNNITHMWYRDGVDVMNTPSLRYRSQIFNDGSLVISSTHSDDSGEYKCVVTNGLGAPMEAKAWLSVTFSPRVGRIKASNELPIGMTGILECPVEGNPPVTNVVWTRNDVPVDVTSDRYTLTKEWSLVIHNVSERLDQGWYTCTPFNENGRGTGSGLMSVYPRDPPYFISRPKESYHSRLGQSITMSCSAGGTSRSDGPVISWRKLGGLMPPASRIYLNHGNLTLYNIAKSDNGRYECVAINNIASIIASTEIIVENTTPHAPYNVTVVLGHYDATISWRPGYDGGYQQYYAISFRETDVINSQWHSLPGHDDNSLEYTIYGLIPETEYEFRVLARNALGDGLYSEAVKASTLANPTGPLFSSTAKLSSPPRPTSTKSPRSFIPVDGLDQLPMDASGNPIFPDIVKQVGPPPSAPVNLTVHQEKSGAINISWDMPLESPVPILYYMVESMRGSTEWIAEPPLLNRTNTLFTPDSDSPRSETIKYSFRVQAFGLLAYSDYTPEEAIYIKSSNPPKLLTQSATISIAVVSLLIVIILVIGIVVMIKTPPCRRKERDRDQSANAVLYTKPNNSVLSSQNQWQTYENYHGRHGVDGNILIMNGDIHRSTENILQSSHNTRSRNRTGWMSSPFRRRANPEPYSYTLNDDASLHNVNDIVDSPGVHYPSQRSLRSNNMMLTGYYDARTGTQMSPSTRNYPLSSFNRTVSDGHTTLEPWNTISTISHGPMFTRRPSYSGAHNSGVHTVHSQGQRSRSSLPVNDSSWYPPHEVSFVHNGYNSPPSPIPNPMYTSQEVLLKHSLPRHSSMIPHHHAIVRQDSGYRPFDPSLSTVRETSYMEPPTRSPHMDPAYNIYPEIHGNDGHVFHPPRSFEPQRYDVSSWSRNGYQNPYRNPVNIPHDTSKDVIPLHMVGDYGGKVTSLPRPMALVHPSKKESLSYRSSVSSGFTADHGKSLSRYNRDRLLGTVDRVRKNSSRNYHHDEHRHSNNSSRQGSFIICDDVQQMSPQYYNTNNNRAGLSSPHSNSSMAEAMPLSVPGLLSAYKDYMYEPSNTVGHSTSIKRKSSEPSRNASSMNATSSGLGSSWATSKPNSSNHSRLRQIQSVSTAPTHNEYDFSGESSPAWSVPEAQHYPVAPASQPFRNGYYNNTPPPAQFRDDMSGYSRYSFDPADNGSLTRESTYQIGQLQQTPSDSVDEQYEFDPVLADLPEPYKHSYNTAPVQYPANNGKHFNFYTSRPLYAEQTYDQQPTDRRRFQRLREEFYHFRERQRSYKLESDIL